MLDGALREAPTGVLIDVDVRPGAGETRVTGYNEWRRAVTLDVAAPPEKGRANRELEAYLSRIAGRGAAAKVVAGATSRRKTVLVAGVTPVALRAALRRALP